MASRAISKPGPTAPELEAFLRGFMALEEAALDEVRRFLLKFRTEYCEREITLEEAQEFFAGLRKKTEGWIGNPPGLNIFQILDVRRDELAVCRFLHWLLNPNGSHWLGRRFLNWFLAEVCRERAEPEKGISVRREVRDGDSRYDILIERKSLKRVVCVEAKIDSDEGEGQLEKYHKAWTDRGYTFNGIFLAPAASSKEYFRHVTWSGLADCMKRFIADTPEVQASPTRILIEQYIDAIKSISAQPGGGPTMKSDLAKYLIENLSLYRQVKAGLESDGQNGDYKRMLGELHETYQRVDGSYKELGENLRRKLQASMKPLVAKVFKELRLKQEDWHIWYSDENSAPDSEFPPRPKPRDDVPDEDVNGLDLFCKQCTLLDYPQEFLNKGYYPAPELATRFDLSRGSLDPIAFISPADRRPENSVFISGWVFSADTGDGKRWIEEYNRIIQMHSTAGEPAIKWEMYGRSAGWWDFWTQLRIEPDELVAHWDDKDLVGALGQWSDVLKAALRMTPAITALVRKANAAKGAGKKKPTAAPKKRRA